MPTVVRQVRRKNLDAPVDASETRNSQSRCGALPWMLSVGLGFAISSVHGKLRSPTIESLHRATSWIRDVGNDTGFELVFRAVNFKEGSTVGDAAFGNIVKNMRSEIANLAIYRDVPVDQSRRGLAAPHMPSKQYGLGRSSRCGEIHAWIRSRTPRRQFVRALPRYGTGKSAIGRCR